MPDEAIIAADAHLDVEPWTGRPIHGDSFFAFERLVDKAIATKVKCLIVAGDLIDVRRPPAQVVYFLREQLLRLEDSGIWFGSIDGQHELADPPWIAAVSSQARPLHRCVTVIAGKILYGINWTPADRLAEELALIPEKTHFLVCHQVWSEFMGDLTSPEGSLEDVPHARVIFTGDYHSTEILKLGKGRTVYSPGATHMRKIDEPVSHCYFVINDKGEVRKENLPGRVVFKVTISKEASLIKLKEAWQKHVASTRSLPEELRKPLMRVSYPADRPDLKKLVRDLYYEQAHLFWKKLPVEKADSVSLALSAERVQQLGPAGCLEYVVPRHDSRYKPLLRLLLAKDRKAELLAMRAERGLETPN